MSPDKVEKVVDRLAVTDKSTIAIDKVPEGKIAGGAGSGAPPGEPVPCARYRLQSSVFLFLALAVIDYRPVVIDYSYQSSMNSSPGPYGS
jgi:hypothetical protein